MKDICDTLMGCVVLAGVALWALAPYILGAYVALWLLDKV